MIRLGAFFVGLFFAVVLVYSAGKGLYMQVFYPPAETAEHAFHKHPKKLALASDGPFGKFDRAQLQRGMQVYKEVCASCHGLQFVAFRDMKDLGYNEGQIKNFAGEYTIQDVNTETGEISGRKGKPSDYFPSPYPNAVAAAAANNGLAPPDLSLITKARHDGKHYLYSLLTGYTKPDPELAKRFPASMPSKTTYYNPYFANLNIGMPAPLHTEGQVKYAPGNPKPTVDQMSQDVTAFLVWAAEPKMENRNRAGLATIIFLLLFTWLTWGAYKNIWATAKKK